MVINLTEKALFIGGNTFHRRVSKMQPLDEFRVLGSMLWRMIMEVLSYHLCPTCQRAVPASAGKVYCPNDGSRMLTACPYCGAKMSSPYTRFCTSCGENLFDESLHSSHIEHIQNEKPKDNQI